MYHIQHRSKPRALVQRACSHPVKRVQQHGHRIKQRKVEVLCVGEVERNEREDDATVPDQVGHVEVDGIWVGLSPRGPSSTRGFWGRRHFVFVLWGV